MNEKTEETKKIDAPPTKSGGNPPKFCKVGVKLVLVVVGGFLGGQFGRHFGDVRASPCLLV